MSPEDLVRFAKRDWAAIDAAKTRHWLRRKAAMSSVELWQLGSELRQHARTMRPEGPGLADRLADIDTHQRVSRALRAVTHSAS